MPKSIVIVGALDTKAADFAFVKEGIERLGFATLLVDFGVMGAPGLRPDIDRAQVAAAGGGSLAPYQGGEAKDAAMALLTRGLIAVVGDLHRDGRLDGIIGMGGTGGTSIAAAAMRGLPLGVPKVIVSTLGGGDVGAYSGGRDIVFLPSIVDVAGLNSISRRIYTNAIGAIAGMVAMEKPTVIAADRPLVTASMFGNSTTAVANAQRLLEESGYEVLVFHATGAGGRTMEALIADGHITASLDLTTTELADYIAGGVFSAGAERCLAAGHAGIPAVLAPGCVDMVNFFGAETVPERYRARQLYAWNANVTLMRTNVAENTEIGRMIGRAANAATGPVSVLLPLGGVSMLGEAGGRFHDPAADRACFDAIRATLRRDIPIIEIDAAINDAAFFGAAAAELMRLTALAVRPDRGISNADS